MRIRPFKQKWFEEEIVPRSNAQTFRPFAKNLSIELSRWTGQHFEAKLVFGIWRGGGGVYGRLQALPNWK
jgi:hypothetical protein